MDTLYPKKTLWVVDVEKILVDEKGKEKKSKESFLVESSTTENLQSIITQEMPYCDEWEIISIKRSNVTGIILE